MNGNEENLSGSIQVVAVLGAGSIVLMQFESGARLPSLAKLRIEPMVGDEDVAVRLSRAFKTGKFAAVPVIGLIPLHLSTVRILELPSTDVDEITNMVDLQVPKQTPYSVDEIFYDYRILGTTRSGYSRVLLGIVKRDIVRQRYQLLEAAGLRIGRMTLDVEGVLTWASSLAGAESPASGAQVLIDLGAEGTGCYVFRDGALAFARGIRLGSAAFRNEPESSVALLDETRRSMDAYHGEHPDVEWRRLMLAGAMPPDVEPAARFARDMALEFVALDVPASLKRTPPGVSMATSPYADVSLCAGLGAAIAPAALGFDFVPESVSLRRGMRARARTFSAFALLLMTLFVAVSCGAVMNLATRREQLKRLEARAAEKRQEAQRLIDEHAIALAAAQRQDIRGVAYDAVRQIYELLPASVFIDSFEYTTDGGDFCTVEIAGHGTSEDVNTFEQALIRSGRFKDVRSRGKNKVSRDQDLYTFQIEYRLEVATP